MVNLMEWQTNLQLILAYGMISGNFYSEKFDTVEIFSKEHNYPSIMSKLLTGKYILYIS
jgi:hypothetical protein